MATIVNTPPQVQDSSGNGFGFIVGILLLIVVIFALIFYGIPYIRGSIQSTTPQVNIPSHVDVNVNRK